MRAIPKDYPPIVYVPAARHVADPRDLEVLYRETKDGRMALLVYSALDRLMRCCGEDQPWFTLPTKDLQQLWDVKPFDLVLLDLPIPDEERQGASA